MAWATGGTFCDRSLGKHTDLSPGRGAGGRESGRRQAAALLFRAQSLGFGRGHVRGLMPGCLSALGFSPCSAGSTPEPSFPLYLDVLAPYVNQVNLIRAGVPKIVSSLHFASFAYSVAAPGSGLVLWAVLGVFRQ